MAAKLFNSLDTNSKHWAYFYKINLFEAPRTKCYKDVYFSVSGTRIIYERAFLLRMRNSPLSKTPPANLPVIPGVTVPKDPNARKSPEKESNGNEMPQKLQTVTGGYHLVTVKLGNKELCGHQKIVP